MQQKFHEMRGEEDLAVRCLPLPLSRKDKCHLPPLGEENDVILHKSGKSIKINRREAAMSVKPFPPI